MNKKEVLELWKKQHSGPPAVWFIENKQDPEKKDFATAFPVYDADGEKPVELKPSMYRVNGQYVIIVPVTKVIDGVNRLGLFWFTREIDHGGKKL